MKLSELLGEELYKQVEAKINEVNTKETDKLKHVRYADLSEGEYVSKDKYTALETDSTTKAGELVKANELIEQLKKGSGENSEANAKIIAYETEIGKLKAENEVIKADATLKVALLDAGAKPSDIDYLIFRAKEKGDVKITEDGKVKGQEELLAGLKTQCPSQFVTTQQREVEEHRLEQGDNKDGSISKEDFSKMGYQSRMKLFNEQPEIYKELSGTTN